MTDPAAIARVFHVLGVVIWIGGVAMITMVVLPAARSLPSAEEKLRFLTGIERRFSWIARAMVLIVGASGLCMVATFDLWPRFSDASFWWMHGMVVVWTVFALILFVAEPLLHRRIEARILSDADLALRRMQRLHWLLLIASLVVIAGATADAHGYRLFG